ncbi:MAG: YceI family protein [Candidatus Sericytochromatia bacterium]|nr:YceI family protein [Candidatus Sericytochromatia bacterium]
MRLASAALLAFATFAALPATAAPVTYAIDDMHSAAHFKVKHLMVSNVRGSFPAIKGSVVYDAAHPEKSTVEATIDVSSVDTGNAKRDGHLKSPDFFDVEKFPTMTFQSTRVVKATKDGLSVLGNLTLHGVTKPVTLQVALPAKAAKDPWGNMRTGTEATTHIDRRDYGLTWNKNIETGGVLVGEDIAITLEVELIQQAAK